MNSRSNAAGYSVEWSGDFLERLPTCDEHLKDFADFLYQCYYERRDTANVSTIDSTILMLQSALPVGISETSLEQLQALGLISFQRLYEPDK